jgi:hypothetical protein
MSQTNDALLYNLALSGFPVNDNISCPNASSQATATRATGDAVRVTNSVANGSMILPSILSQEAPPLIFVINDSPNAIKVYPFLSTVSPESMNTTNNAALTIAAGGWGMFVKIPPLTQKGGGTQGTSNWSGSAGT